MLRGFTDAHKGTTLLYTTQRAKHAITYSRVVPLWASVVSKYCWAVVLKYCRSVVLKCCRYNRLLSFLLYTFLVVGLSACGTPGTNLLGSGSWEVSTLSHQHIHALTVLPDTPQVLYAGDADGTILRSSDSGQHWAKRAPISSAPLLLLMLTVNPPGKTLYALTDRGLFTSTDAAQSWQLASTPKSGLPVDSYTTMTFNEQKSMYVGTLHHGIFMNNANGSSHWQAIDGTLPSTIAINELAYDSTQHRLWAATSLSVYRSDNEGANWDAFNSGLNVADGVTFIQPAASVGGASGLVYAGTKHGIYRSTDAGVHWTESGQVLRGVPIQHILIDFRSTNASTLYVGTRYGVFRSDDNGLNWLGVAAGFPKNTAVYALVIGADKASQLYVAANNIYLYPGTDNGINPTRVITLLLVLVFFGLLALMTRRSITRRKTLFRPRNTPETSSSTIKS